METKHLVMTPTEVIEKRVKCEGYQARINNKPITYNPYLVLGKKGQVYASIWDAGWNKADRNIEQVLAMESKYLDEAILSLRLLVATDNTGDHDLPNVIYAKACDLLAYLELYRDETQIEVAE